MKNLILPLIFCLVMQSCFTTHQNPDVQTTTTPVQQLYAGGSVLKAEEIPQPVITSWNRDYSKVYGEQWYKQDDGYVVYHLHKKLLSRVAFNEQGKVVMTSREVKPESVPFNIREYMKAKYPGTQYGKTYLSYPGKGVKRYEVEVGNKWEYFDGEGKNIK
ncbi:MAG: PepSY-like domain-containing protein [Chitinophagales bacterium]